MRSWWKRLWCAHYWVKGQVTDIVFGKGYEYEYTCEHCGKKIRRVNTPISYIE